MSLTSEKGACPGLSTDLKHLNLSAQAAIVTRFPCLVASFVSQTAISDSSFYFESKRFLSSY